MTVLDLKDLERAVGRTLIGREEFSALLGEALVDGCGFAAGKIGYSEQSWLMYPVLLDRGIEPLQQRAFEAAMASRSLRHAGIWPAERSFLGRFCERFAADVVELDAIGLFEDALSTEIEVLRFHRPPGALMRFVDQEPDRSSGEASNDWLEHLRGRRVVLVCPFADLLRERANEDTYERVWESTGRPWFAPASIESVELPYGFDPATQDRFDTALDLLDAVDSRITALDYDCALIAAGGLGIPLAVRSKQRGRAAISLGGHLQVLFGVHGARWRGRAEWEGYFNDAWIGVPEQYRPAPGLTEEDYW